MGRRDAILRERNEAVYHEGKYEQLPGGQKIGEQVGTRVVCGVVCAIL